jgi:hypothetical protein
MVANGIVFHLPPLAQTTRETASSLLPTLTVQTTVDGMLINEERDRLFPTPQASDYITKKTSKSWEEKGAVNFCLSNPDVMSRFPTLRASDWKTDVNDSGEYANRHSGFNTLPMNVKRFPTPSASFGMRYHSCVVERRYYEKRTDMTEEEKKVFTQGIGTLNPDWVEWLMGFPLFWTVCDEYNNKKKFDVIYSRDDIIYEENGWWGQEHNIPRIKQNVRNRISRIRCLGNAVVPQVAEIFALAIGELYYE